MPKQIVDETEKVKVLLQSGAPVYVSIAPSFVANYDGVGIGAMREALQKLGFADAEETAIGATIVKTEYERMLREDGRDVIISSCCHSINLLIQKYYPGGTCVSCQMCFRPMQAHCTDIKNRHPGRKDGLHRSLRRQKRRGGALCSGIVDAVLTFEELTDWLKAENIELEQQMRPRGGEPRALLPDNRRHSQDDGSERTRATHIWHVDGADNCIAALREISSRDISITALSKCPPASAAASAARSWRNIHRSPVRDYHGGCRIMPAREDFDVDQPDQFALRKYLHGD